MTPPRRIVLPAGALREGPTALRPWRDSDLGALVAACQDPDIARWTRVPSPYGESDARGFLLARYDALHAGTAATFAVVDPDDDRVLFGSIALMRLDWRHRRGEVGYWLAAEARGRGHASRAVQVVCDWGGHALGLERITLLAAVANLPSQAVAERSGFAREGVLRSYMTSRDGRLDMVAFGRVIH